MGQNKKVVKFHTVPNINIGIIIFGLIFIFIVVQIVRSVNMDHVSVYEVQNSYLDTNISGVAMALREETIVTTTQAGYVNYYIRNGEKVGKNATVYTLDSTGTLSDLIAEASNNDTKLSNAGYSEIRTSISSFQNYFSNVNFSDVYDFKYDLESQVLDIANTQVLEELTSGDNSSVSFSQIASTQSGVVTYFQDGYETKSPQDITSADFNMETYTKSSLKTGEILQSGSPVYKLITSENWNLLLPLSDEDAQRLKEDTRVTLNLPNISHEVYGDLEVIENAGEYFAKITLDKLMINYCDERFIEIEIVMTKEEGLNVPNTAILEKQVIKIPEAYMVAGSNSTARTNVNVRILDEDGNLSIEQMSPTIYDKDDDYYYVNPDDFAENTVLVMNNSDETLSISQAARMTMTGVYNINRGIATFEKVTVLASDEDFSIVEAGDTYSLSLYDRIILDASMIEEGTMIH
jgi:hypothetical protein